MGNATSQPPQSEMALMQGRVEARVGKLPITGRFHKGRNIEDDYEVCETVLGTGYNGAVRLAMGKGSTDGQKFAVKAFDLSNASKTDKEHLTEEVEIFLAMDHPHIIRLFDVYDSGDNLYLVMECMEGGELFEQVSKLQRFTERDAATACFQILLALNYIHSHGVVHRDIKLENFLCEKGGNHLKLIDFGFSKMWDATVKMEMSCGTLSYIAPEVLQRSYTSKCDLWSLGVIVFVLLSGYMPFGGDKNQQIHKISTGQCALRSDRWSHISTQAKKFVASLFMVDAEKRPSAQQALEHEWIVNRQNQEIVEIDTQCVNALRAFSQASKFRRCCLEMMAWSLSNDDRAMVRKYFIAMDQKHQGTITLNDLRKVLTDRFDLPDDEARTIFESLDTNQDEEIHYSDFLAAMVSTRIALHDNLLKNAFKKFDTDSSGYITVQNLKEVLGDKFEGVDVQKLLVEADKFKDGRVSYDEFVSYMRGDPLQMSPEQNSRANSMAAEIIDRKLQESKLDATLPSTSASKCALPGRTPRALRARTGSFGSWRCYSTQEHFPSQSGKRLDDKQRTQELHLRRLMSFRLGQTAA